MKLPQAILLSALVLSFSLIYASLNPAESQRASAGYMVASDGGQFVWRVNTSTGELSYCVRRDNSTDKQFIATRPPFCSASTPAQ